MNCSVSKRFVSRQQRCALTLVEVVVGLVLMATVLVASLMALAAQRRQYRQANHQLIAVGIADEIMNQFQSDPDGMPASGQGFIAGRTGWMWRTRVIGMTSPAGVAMPVIRLEVFDERGQPKAKLDVVKHATAGL
ncbi:MAG: hypothetical protein AAGG48_03265 [Planctomycetota bacterium]